MMLMFWCFGVGYFLSFNYHLFRDGIEGMFWTSDFDSKGGLGNWVFYWVILLG